MLTTSQPWWVFVECYECQPFLHPFRSANAQVWIFQPKRNYPYYNNSLTWVVKRIREANKRGNVLSLMLLYTILGFAEEKRVTGKKFTALFIIPFLDSSSHSFNGNQCIFFFYFFCVGFTLVNTGVAEMVFLDTSFSCF